MYMFVMYVCMFVVCVCIYVRVIIFIDFLTLYEKKVLLHSYSHTLVEFLNIFSHE